jgi:hypothetical protein
MASRRWVPRRHCRAVCSSRSRPQVAVNCPGPVFTKTPGGSSGPRTDARCWVCPVIGSSGCHLGDHRVGCVGGGGRSGVRSCRETRMGLGRRTARGHRPACGPLLRRHDPHRAWWRQPDESTLAQACPQISTSSFRSPSGSWPRCLVRRGRRARSAVGVARPSVGECTPT